MRHSIDTHGGIVKGGGYAPLHVQSTQKWELFLEVPIFAVKLSTLCRQLELPPLGEALWAGEGVGPYGGDGRSCVGAALVAARRDHKKHEERRGESAALYEFAPPLRDRNLFMPGGPRPSPTIGRKIRAGRDALIPPQSV